MKEEGKFSRALARAGEPERLGEQVRAAGSPPDLRAHADAANEVKPVKGRAGELDLTVVMRHKRTGEAATHIRGLRAQLLSRNNGDPPRVISVTSGTRREGKTTTALNLAVSLAEVDPGRVLLVDGDMRGPRAHLLANVKPTKGLKEVLVNDLDLTDCIYETAVDRLDLLPCTVSDADDCEGLLAQHCQALLAKLRRLYSFVIVDTPPVMAASQASTFGKYSDGVLLVARLEHTPREVVMRAIRELRAGGGKLLGCVLTDRKHHVPNIVYRFFGTPPDYYYRYARYSQRDAEPSAPLEEQDGAEPES